MLVRSSTQGQLRQGRLAESSASDGIARGSVCALCDGSPAERVCDESLVARRGPLAAVSAVQY